MKKTTLLVGAFLCAICSFAQGEYPINWDKDANLSFTRSDRQTSSVSITVDGEQQTIDVMSKSGVVYRDFSDQTFTVQPGAEIVPSMAYKGEWMHGYVYLDTNNNKLFDVESYQSQEDELVAFSFYSPTDASNGVNGIGESKSNNCNVNPMNAFTAPEKPGQYRMRYVIDWNCIDPAGQYGSKYTSNFINANGGVIVDVTLVVEGAAPVVPEYNTTTKFFTAPELRAEADATGKAFIGIAGVTTTANKYINGKAYNGVLASEEGTLAGLRAPQEDEVLEVIATEGGYLLRQADAAEGEGYLKCAAGGNFTTSVAADANVWSILGPGEDGYGDITGWDDLYSDIDKSYNENMVRFISNGQYLNGQNRDGVGGLRGGKGAWSFNYVYNANYTEGGEVVDPVDPEPFVPVEYGPVLLSEGDNLVCFKIHNLGADDGSYKGNDCYVKYVAESAGTWNSLFHTETADDADNFAFFAAEDGGVYIKDVTANKFVTWKQNAEGGINWGAHELTACQVTLVDAVADAKSWFIADDENTEGRYDILPLEGANNGWSFMGGIDQSFVVLNLEKKTDRNIKWVFEKVEGETPVDPEPPVVEPEELTWSPVEAGSIYAIVNLQPTGNNFYLDYLEGNLSPVPAGECNTLYEWPETAKFQAVKLADGRFAFKNCGTGNYLAWKGTANRNNTTGVYNNQGYDPAINEHSSWTLNESTRYEGAYWLRAEQRNDIPGDGQNLTGSPIIGNDGAWNAWTTGEYLPANGTAFSNSFAFYLIEKPEAPVYDYAAAIAPVLAEANEVLEGHDNVWVTTISDKLITRNGQFTSNNSDPQEGSLNNLLDGNANTFWHSNWHQGNNRPMHSDWLQVELDEAIDGDVLLTFVRRAGAANDQVTLLDVETSMDGENFTHAAYIDMPNSGAGKTEQKVFALEEKAKFLRFWADATTNNRAYWHVGDFQLQTSKTELNIDAPDYAYPTAVKDLQDAIAATPTADGTEADVEALQAAIEAYKAALAGYPEFTEWNGEIAINVGEVKSIDDLLNVDFIFNRAANIERGYSVLGAIFDQTGDAYGLVLDGFCGDVDYKTVKNAELVAKVASVEFAKISDFVGDVQAQAKAAAAKIGAFQPEAGHAYVLIASKSFLVDGELFNEFKKFDCTLATGVITGVETIVVPASEVMFDLQGRRTNSTNGLRILNGRVVR